MLLQALHRQKYYNHARPQKKNVVITQIIIFASKIFFGEGGGGGEFDTWHSFKDYGTKSTSLG